MGWPYNDAGHLLEPRMLGSDKSDLGPSGHALRGSIPLTALFFLKARDRDEAMSIAAGHPGLPYGASIEVRDWSGPVRPAATQHRKHRRFHNEHCDFTRRKDSIFEIHAPKLTHSFARFHDSKQQHTRYQ
jgi:hypothetical protein